MLKIEITSNLKIENFLDVTLNLEYNNTQFKPVSKKKNNNTPTYISVNSNYNRSLLKQIPNAVTLRIIRLSSFKKVFEESKRAYKEALEKSGFQN